MACHFADWPCVYSPPAGKILAQCVSCGLPKLGKLADMAGNYRVWFH